MDCGATGSSRLAKQRRYRRDHFKLYTCSLQRSTRQHSASCHGDTDFVLSLFRPLLLEMFRNLKLLLVWLILVPDMGGASIPRPALHFTKQLVDHFSSPSEPARTYSQRYYQISKHFGGPGSPIICIMGGEGAILPSTGIFYPWVGNDLAARFKVAPLNGHADDATPLNRSRMQRPWSYSQSIVSTARRTPPGPPRSTQPRCGS